MDLSALHRSNGGNTDNALESDNTPDEDIDSVLPVGQAEDHQEIVDSDEVGSDHDSVYSLPDDDRYETVSEVDSEDSRSIVDSLPDLETDPLQTSSGGILADLSDIPDRVNDERECWVCFLSESETPDAGRGYQIDIFLPFLPDHFAIKVILIKLYTNSINKQKEYLTV